MAYLDSEEFVAKGHARTSLMNSVYQTSNCNNDCWVKSLAKGGAQDSQPNGLPSIYAQRVDDQTFTIHFNIGDNVIDVDGIDNGWNHYTISKDHYNTYTFYVNNVLKETLYNLDNQTFPESEIALLFGSSNSVTVGIDHISVSERISQGRISKLSIDHLTWFEQFGDFIHSGNTLLDIGGAQLSRAQGIDSSGRVLPVFHTEEHLTMTICAYNARFPVNVERSDDGTYVEERDVLVNQSRTLLVKHWHHENCRVSDQFAIENKIDSTRKLHVFREQIDGTIPYCVANLISNSYSNHFVGGHTNIPVFAGENLTSIIFPNTEECTNLQGIWEKTFVFYAFEETQGEWTTEIDVCVSDNDGIIVTEKIGSISETRIMTIADSEESCVVADSKSPLINYGNHWVEGFEFFIPEHPIKKSGISHAFPDHLPDIYRQSSHGNVNPSVNQNLKLELGIQNDYSTIECEIVKVAENLFLEHSNFFALDRDCYNLAGSPSGMKISVTHKSSPIHVDMMAYSLPFDPIFPSSLDFMPIGIQSGSPSSIEFEVGDTIEFNFASGAHGTLWSPVEMPYAIPYIDSLSDDDGNGHYLIEGIIPVGSGCIISSTLGYPELVKEMGSWCHDYDPRILYNLGGGSETYTFEQAYEGIYFYEMNIGENGPKIMQMLETHSDGNIIFNKEGKQLPMPNEYFETDLTHNAITVSTAVDPSYRPSNSVSSVPRVYSALFSNYPTYLCADNHLEYDISTPLSSYNQYLDTDTDDDMRPQIFLELEYEIINLDNEECNDSTFNEILTGQAVSSTDAASDSIHFRYSPTTHSPGMPNCADPQPSEIGRLTSKIRGNDLSKTDLKNSFDDSNQLKKTKIKVCNLLSNQMIRIVNWALTFENDHSHGHWEATISKMKIYRSGSPTGISADVLDNLTSGVLGVVPYREMINANVGYDESKTVIKSHNF